MPLIKSSSKKAFEQNVEREMDSGKPQKQALAIAYDIKRRNKRKKMAEGGAISASNEKRPMPDDKHNDSKMASHNSSKKPLVESSWTDSPTVKQAQKPSHTKLSRPRMVESSVIRSKMHDDEEHMMSRMEPDGYGKQPSKVLDEEDADKSGPQVPDMQRQHNNSRKPYAKGGMINNKVSMKAAEEDHEEHPAGLESDDDQMRPKESDYMSDHEQMLAEGGEIHREMMIQPEDEAEEEHHDSIAAAIMARKERQTRTHSDSDMDRMIRMAEGGQVDIEENAKEQPNSYYHRNEVAALKENYDSDMSDMSQPHDSNLIGDEREEDESDPHDRVSKIRSRMNMKRQFR